jgi:hypothetical protein
MKLFYKRTKEQNIHLIWQSMLVFVIMFGFMYAIKQFTHADTALGAIGATSLGSSAFLAFVAHDTAMARARRMISGYAIGLIVGAIGSFVLITFSHCHNFDCPTSQLDVLVSAGAAMLCMILMVTLSSEHPPAVGIAIGLILRDWDLTVLILIIATVLVIAIVKGLLRPWLLNLL